MGSAPLTTQGCVSSVTMNGAFLRASEDQSTLGELLRLWRRSRQLSQLALSLETGVSARHLSCIETGRARPSRAMILRLADHLDVPLRERNRFLLAGGYSPAYQENPPTKAGKWPARKAIDRLLNAHEPFPALVFTITWRLVAANRPLWWLLEGLPDELLRPPINVMRVALHPTGLITRVRNPAAWHRLLYVRLRHTAVATGDPELLQLEQEIRGFPVPGRRGEPSLNRHPPFATLRFRHEGLNLDFISTVATFGTPPDITTTETMIESLYPANTSTAQAMTQSARWHQIAVAG